MLARTNEAHGAMKNGDNSYAYIHTVTSLSCRKPALSLSKTRYFVVISPTSKIFENFHLISKNRFARDFFIELQILFAN
jgi:hypothetical protein